MVDVSDLDAKALEVLEAVYESGGEANTSEIKEYTGIRKNGIVHYRYEKLEDAGLIETKSGDSESTQFTTTVAVLTEEGEQEIRGGLLGDEGATMVERMERLERQYRQAQDALREVRRDFERWRYDEEADEEIDAVALRDQVEAALEGRERIEAKLEEFEEFESEQYDADSLTESVSVMENRVQGVNREMGDLREDVEDMAHLLALDSDAIREDWDRDAVRFIQEEENRLDRAEESAQKAWEAAEEAKEEAGSGPTAKEVQSLEQKVSVLESQLGNREEESLPSGSFWSRLRWLLTGSAP
jgi:hypothetical protein